MAINRRPRQSANLPPADFVSAFPAGVSIASTWDRYLIRQRGADMGMEHKLKGVDIQLGPVVGPLGRSPEGGRNWEGLSKFQPNAKVDKV